MSTLPHAASPRLPVVVPFLLLLGAAHGQDGMQAPKPAPELARLKPFVGSWRGEGTATMQPGAPASKWTAQVLSQWALGGFFLQTDTEIEFAGMPAAMRFREYMGWDGENQRYVSLAVNNMGEGVLGSPHFVGDDTMVMMIAWMREGQPQFERAVTKYGADAQSFSITFLRHEGPAAEGVSGSFKRVDKVEPKALEAAAALAPPNPLMAKLARMTGEYDFQGEMVMGPGAPATKIKGHDVVRPLFGGSIVSVATTGSAEGSPAPYEAHGFYAFDATKNCYAMLYVNNMGQVGSMDTRFLGDDKLVAVFAGLQMGMPTTSRLVLQLDSKGKMVGTTNHSCMGDGAPVRDFHGTYTAVK